MNEVCAAAQVSKGSLYHHFPSKDELFLYVAELDTEQWLAEWDSKKSGISGTEERLYALGEHYANDFQNPLIRAIEDYARIRSHSDEINQRLSQIYESASRACRELLQEGMDSGFLVRGDLDKYVVILSGLLEGIGRVSEITALAKAPEDIMKYYREAIQLLLQGMRTR
jgi:AcrR family transcriptional regulator